MYTPKEADPPSYSQAGQESIDCTPRLAKHTVHGKEKRVSIAEARIRFARMRRILNGMEAAR